MILPDLPSWVAGAGAALRHAALSAAPNYSSRENDGGGATRSPGSHARWGSRDPEILHVETDMRLCERVACGFVSAFFGLLILLFYLLESMIDFGFHFGS